MYTIKKDQLAKALNTKASKGMVGSREASFLALVTMSLRIETHSSKPICCEILYERQSYNLHNITNKKHTASSNHHSQDSCSVHTIIPTVHTLGFVPFPLATPTTRPDSFTMTASEPLPPLHGIRKGRRLNRHRLITTWISVYLPLNASKVLRHE